MKKSQPGSFGRTLTPFFLEGETVNEELEIPKNEVQKQKTLYVPRDNQIKIRKFTDGYFVNEILPLEKIELDENLNEMVDSNGKKTPIKQKKEKPKEIEQEKKEKKEVSLEFLLGLEETKTKTPKVKKEFLTPQPQPVQTSILTQLFPKTDQKPAKRKLEFETPKKTHFAGLEWDTPPDPSRLPIPNFD